MRSIRHAEQELARLRCWWTPARAPEPSKLVIRIPGRPVCGSMIDSGAAAVGLWRTATPSSTCTRSGAERFASARRRSISDAADAPQAEPPPWSVVSRACRPISTNGESSVIRESLQRKYVLALEQHHPGRCQVSQAQPHRS